MGFTRRASWKEEQVSTTGAEHVEPSAVSCLSPRQWGGPGCRRLDQDQPTERAASRNYEACRQLAPDGAPVMTWGFTAPGYMAIRLALFRIRLVGLPGLVPVVRHQV
jgi:hypothetical protein